MTSSSDLHEMKPHDVSPAGDEMPTWLLALIVGVAAVAIAVLVWTSSSASLEWPLGDVYLRLIAVFLVANLLGVAVLNPRLIRRRAFPGPGTKKWDWALLVLLVPCMLGVFIVAGVDGGDWPAGTPGAAWWSGVVLFAAGWTLVIWSMIVNPFFEKTVRIQIENDHRVVDTGPYACVRHPGYVGFSLWMISTPLLLASRLAVIPAVCATAVFVVRVVLEDRMLRRELPGYAEYATRTRFRLIPGVW